MCYVTDMKALKEYLHLTGMTQEQLAKRAGLHPTAVNHFLNGEREPRIANLRKLSQATGISIEKLVEGLGE